MRKHIFRSDVDKLISEGKELLKGDVDMLLAYRISMVLLVLQGMPALQLAEFTDCEARTIQLWVDAVDKEGFDALKPQSKSGRRQKLNDKQKATIKKALSADPSLEGYTVWDESNEEYADIRAKVTFLDIPPYSPDLNPIEQLWRKARHEVTHNRFFKSLADLKAALANFFGKFVSPNEEIASLCKFNFSKEKHSSDKQLWVGMQYKLFRKNMAKKSVDAILVPI